MSKIKKVYKDFFLYLVGTLDFSLQLHLILPLPQHFLTEGWETWPGILQLGRVEGTVGSLCVRNRNQTSVWLRL